MGYCSQIALKTTSEGWILLKRYNDMITEEDAKPLAYLNVEKTLTGFYKISHTDIKWHKGYAQVVNFYRALTQMEEQNIPFVFIRIGEDIDDIEVKNNWTEDMPDELETFEPQTTIYDEDEGDYETIVASGKDLFTSSEPEEGSDK